MDTVKRMKIQNLREKIVENVDVSYIIDHLISNEVVTEDEWDRIKAEKTRKDKTRHLLDLLPRKNIKAFDHFVEALKGTYPWLSSELQADGPQAYQIEEKSYFDSLLLGGLPQAPPYYVERKEKIDEIRTHLHSLERGNYVVLHGMTGYGKSCLATAALDNKQLLIEKFNGAVYWISVGDATSDNLLCHMTDLMEKLSHHPQVEPEEMKVQSSISEKGATESLRRYFTSFALRDGLLILDDVPSSDFIDAFDIGCKILVTTKDREVMRTVEGRYNLITISKGFTEQESLSLIANCVGLSVSKLPPEAKKIHNLTKGTPMVIALIGAQLAEIQDDAKRNSGRWKYYVDNLTKRDYRIIRRNSFSPEKELFNAIGICVDILSEEMKSLYQDFALFVEDVNIKPEVLGTLWSRNKYEVEDIMSYFLKKSLAVSKWNELLNSYVYGIHDLLLCYLKEMLSDENKKALHKKLLDSYAKVCDGIFANLPNDNYFFFYVGHHLSEAEMWHMFPKLYLDLEFVGAKLKYTGPGDVLVDYKKYNQLITNGGELHKAILRDFERFVQKHGLDLHKYHDMDIIQCALQEPRQSHVYKEALKIAKERPNKLYLEFLVDQDTTSQPQTLLVKQEVFAACFTAEEKKILVTNGNGLIHLWDADYAQILCTFYGHSERILHLELSPDGNHFLSCSEDCTVKLWNLDGAICKNKDEEEFDEHGCSLTTPSPRVKQSNWNSFYLNEKVEDRSHRTFSGHQGHVSFATYSPDALEVMSCSKDGSVMIWNCESGAIRLIFQVPSVDCFASACTFAGNNSLVVFGGDDKCVNMYDSSTGNQVATLNASGRVIRILDVAVDEIAVVTDYSLTIWTWEPETNEDSHISAKLLIGKNLTDLNGMQNGAHASSATPYVIQNVKSLELSRLSRSTYTCATLSHDEQYIIIGSSDFKISVWDVDEHRLVKEFQDHNAWVRCLDTYWGASYQMLLSGSDDKTIKIWHLELTEMEIESKSKLQQNFDALWDGKSSDPAVPLFVASDNKNKLQLLRGRSFVTESIPEPMRVNICKLTNCGHFVIYGCSNGCVKVFDIKKKSSSLLMQLSDSVHYLQLYNNDALVVIAADENNGLKIWRGRINEVGSFVSCDGQKDKVVQCFIISLGQKLLSCAQDGSVKLFETTTGKLLDILVKRHLEAKVTTADLSTTENLLVLCSATGYFLIINLTESSFPLHLTASTLQNHVLEDSLRCCKLSDDSRFLALGHDNGNIVIWDVVNGKVLGTLQLHKTWVRDLMFAPSSLICEGSVAPAPIILVSVADQICWWDIGRICTPTARRRMSSGRRRRKRSGESPKLTLRPFESDVNSSSKHDNLVDAWSGKEGRKDKSELLGCVRLIGGSTKISASKDFSAFATVDASGIVYLMKILR